jgi:transposase
MGKTERLVLARKDRRELEELLRQPGAKAGHVRRARIVLLAAEGLTGVAIGERVGMNRFNVSRVRKRFLAAGVVGLADQPKSGRGNNVPEETVRRVIAMAVSAPPAGHSHWSTRELAKANRLGKTVTHKILQANDLKPHQIRTFKVSRDPRFAEKVKDVVGLYLNPPENAVVVSMDEKTQIQALSRTQPVLPLRSGTVERRTHDYKRNGVVDLYAALEISSGRVVGECRDRHTGADFLAFLKKLDRSFPKGELHVILDNSSAHKTPEVMAWLQSRPRIAFHFTPTSASWLNQVEGFFSILTRRSIRRANFPSKAALRRHIEDFLKRWNLDPTPFVWTKKPHRILKDHRKMVARISRAKH